MADLTTNKLPKATGATQIDDSGFSDTSTGTSHVLLSDQADVYQQYPGLTVTFTTTGGGFAASPATGENGYGYHIIFSYGSSGATLAFIGGGGVAGTPAALSGGEILGRIEFNGWIGSEFIDLGAQIYATAAENFEGGKAGTAFHIGTALTGSDTVTDRFLIDGDGNTNIQNGVLSINTAIAVAALPATPTAGMFARVNDATAPAVGVAVVGGGAASAIVCYGGTQWTVIGI